MGYINDKLTKTIIIDKKVKYIRKALEAISTRKNTLLDLFIDGKINKIDKEVYDNKNNSLNNKEVKIKKELSELKSKIGNNGKKALKRIKNLFLYPVNKEKTFFEAKDEKKKK